MERATAGFNPTTQVIDLQRGVESLKKSQSQLAELAKPTSMLGRIRFEIAQRVPFLRDMLEVSPMERMRAEMRSVLIDLTTNLPVLTVSAIRRINVHQELTGFYDEAAREPENWGLTLRLKERLQEEASHDRQLQVDKQTQALIDHVLGIDDPERRSAEQQEIFGSAKQRLALAMPIVKVDEVSIRATVKLREALMRQYSTVLDISPDLDLLHRNSRALMDGVLAGRDSKEVVIKILGQAIEAADLAIKAADLGSRFEGTADQQQLQQISDEAQRLLENVNNEGPERS